MAGRAESIGQAVGDLLVGFLANLFTVPLALLAVSGLLIPALGFIRRSNNLVDNKDRLHPNPSYTFTMKDDCTSDK